MEPQTSGVKTWQWVVTVIVIIVLIVIGIMVFGGKAGAPVVDDQNVPVDQTGVSALNRVVMTDQYPGNVVYLSSAQLENPSWVVIQSDKAGQPGDIIGSAYFDKGISPGTKINLTKPTVDGKTYYAVIYNDDGDKVFNPAKDLPLKDQNGNIIMKVFRASASADVNLKG